MASKLNTLEPEVTLTLSGTAQQISTTSLLSYGAILTAHQDNTGELVVGGSDVNTDNAKRLAAGQSIEISAPAGKSGGSDQFDFQDVYFDGTASSDIIKVAYWSRPLPA